MSQYRSWGFPVAVGVRFQLAQGLDDDALGLQPRFQAGVGDRVKGGNLQVDRRLAKGFVETPLVQKAKALGQVGKGVGAQDRRVERLQAGHDLVIEAPRRSPAANGSG